MQGNSFFGFSGGGGGTPPPTSDGWLLNGNANGAEKYFGTNDNFSIPIYTNGSAIGLFSNTGDFGFGTILPTARVHVVGIDATSSNYALKVDDSASSPLLYVRNDGLVGVGASNTNLFETFNIYKFNTAVSSSLAYNTTNRAVTFLTPNANASYGISSIYDDKLVFGRFNVSGTANGYGFVCGVNGDFTLNADYYTGTSAVDFIYKATSRNIGIRTYVPTAALHLTGQDSTSSNYALKVDNSASSPLFYVRNDGSFSFSSQLDALGVGTNTISYNSTGTYRESFYTPLGYHKFFDFYTNSIRSSYIDEISGYMNIAVSGIFGFLDFNTASAKMWIDITNSGRVGIGNGYFAPSAQLHIKGIDSTSSNYALKVDNSSSSPLLYVRNDAKISIGKATTLTTLDVQGDTTNPLFKLNNSNFLFSDKLRVDNIGSFYSGSINGFGAFGTGDFTTDHLNYTFNTSFSTFLAFTNANLSGNKTSYGIIGGVIGSADSDYRLVILNSDSSTISGSGLKVLSTATSTNNDAFDYYNYGVNINSSGIVTNSGAGTFYKIGLNVSVSNGEVNYAALFNGGNSGFGTLNPTAITHIKGIDSTTKVNLRLEPVTNVTEDTTGNTVNTTDATANVTAQTIAVPTNKVISLESTIVYRKTGGVGVGATGDGTTIKLNSSVKNVGGTLTLDTVQNTYTGTTNAIAGAVATYTISGTNVLVSVTGVVNDNITWNVITKVNTVG